MNLNDLDYSIIHDIYQTFDVDRTWELLGKLFYLASFTKSLISR